jgi:hypothetical protein
MGLRYENLDETTRGFMLKEIDIDDRADTLYRSPWLSQGGQGDWADLLKDAAKTGNDDTLAADSGKADGSYPIRCAGCPTAAE